MAPLYEFYCKDCSCYRERIVSADEVIDIRCSCGKVMKKMVSAPAVLKTHGAKGHPNEPDNVAERNAKRKEQPSTVGKVVKPRKRRKL